MTNTEEPDWVCGFVGDGIAVEEIAHCFIEMALSVLCGDEEGVFD